MSELPASLAPRPGEQGVLTASAEQAGRRALHAWDLMLSVAEQVDLHATARHKRRKARDVLLPLGQWPQTRTLMRSSPTPTVGHTLPDVDIDAQEQAVREAQALASDFEVVDAVRRSRDALAAFLTDPSQQPTSLLLTATPLGPLPVLTFLHAMAYQLALSALDLAACGADPPPQLLDYGVIALVDTTGALATRQGVTGSICAVLPNTVWGFGAGPDGWKVAELDAAAGPAVEASAAVIIDVSAGRVLNVPALWNDGRLKTHDLTGLLALAPVIENVPGIPGGAALRTASKYLGGVSRLLGKLPWPS